MKLVMSTTLAAGVLTLLATGLAEAENKNCTNIRKECKASLPGGTGSCGYWDRFEPIGKHARISECVVARGCAALYPRNAP